MKKQKRTQRFNYTPPGRSTRSAEEIKPEELVPYLRRAEKEVIPLIRQAQLPPGPAHLLLAQYAYAFATGDSGVSINRAMTMANVVLALWHEGTYTPGPQYPYSYVETIRDIQGQGKPVQDYRSSFQKLTVAKGQSTWGKKTLACGLVQHPETNLWQLWMLIDGPCEHLGAYRDPQVAQEKFAEFIAAVRRGASPGELKTLSQRIKAQGDGRPKQISFDMLNYLMENIKQYQVPL